MTHDNQPRYGVAPTQVSSADDDPAYNGVDDFAKSIEFAYAVIRERKANGGAGWEPKPPRGAV